MRTRFGRVALVAMLTFGVTSGLATAGTLSSASSTWVGTWEAAPASGVDNTPGGYTNYSIRNVVHTTVGGSQTRIRLSNRWGAAPVTFGHVTVGVQARVGTADAASLVNVTFHGKTSTTVAAGADIVSDAVPLRVPSNSNLLVTTYVPTPSGPVTYHPLAMQTSFFTPNGDHSGDAWGTAYTQTTNVWHYVTGIDVLSPNAKGTVVAFGDSITDGYGSTPDANHRWPNYLSERIGQRYGVIDAGISGNRLLLDGGPAGEAAVKRLDEDVLSRTDVHSMIVLLGVNDIQQSPHQLDPTKIEGALQDIAQRAHARGIRTIASTILPFKGFDTWTPQLETVRQAVNQWIRTSGVYDTVVDFDQVVRDPSDPERMLPVYDCGDHLHPGDAGYQAMAYAVDPNSL
ncbi:SGNH/GDSL hydrolase family protein [Kutzneria buriramensis]|uniref:Lysophospholipase L1-like esterase n=1 Tax=Kutzneria buriramensis TaxID=1045776 RepID=A0A3E0HV32_9PSEU|nr:SGNH/GDSL hydrolase family protein [Kutzneria buriramensis]REH49815.1 lysophospholipase L1-like esterase [Kutzneria buriramensis]